MGSTGPCRCTLAASGTADIKIVIPPKKTATVDSRAAGPSCPSIRLPSKGSIAQRGNYAADLRRSRVYSYGPDTPFALKQHPQRYG